MSLDLFQSRRNYNEFCEWWSRDETDKYTAEELIMQRVPTGVFMAREYSPEVNQDAIVGGVFRFDKTTITIKTPDDVYGIKNDDIVRYDGEMWFVENVQKVKARIQNSMFVSDKACSHFWFISLRK